MPAACKNRGNIVYVGFITRALAPALVDWIVRGVQPPASNFPTIASGLLAHSSSRAAVGFPNLHAIGAEYTDTYNFLYQTDYSVIPPQIDPTRQYQVLVPSANFARTDADDCRIRASCVPTTSTPWCIGPR